MSGITGIYYLNGRVLDRAVIERMNTTIAHRGTDDAGVWHTGAVGLGHRMLWATPESRTEKLPFIQHEGQLVITADARIDNRDELLVSLDFGQRQPHTIPDSALILAAYERWGEQCVDHLLGDFVFAIWDGRQQQLFCARDHLGLKPLYYYHHPGQGFYFASEIKALLSLPDVPDEINDSAVLDYLSVMFEDQRITTYEDIWRLPPAHILTVNPHKITLNCYWQLDPDYELHLESDAAYAARYREILTEAVRCRMRSADPVGSMLSGGLDSSSIACLARQIMNETGAGDQKLPTFSSIYEFRKECDEREFMHAVLDTGGYDPNFIYADQYSPLLDVDKVLWHMDQPYFAPNLFMTWALWGKAQEKGVRVMLDGFMGDLTVSNGESYLIEMAQQFRYLKLYREVKALAKHDFFDQPAAATLTYIKRRSLKPLLPQMALTAWRKLRGQPAPHPYIAPIVNSNLAERLNYQARLNQLAEKEFQTLRHAREYHYNELVSGDIGYGSELVNHLAAAAGIEVRLPFLDKRLVEFCLAIPARQKLSGGWPRLIVRRGLEGVLPPAIQWRYTKARINSNLEKGLLHFEQARLDKLFSDQAGALEPYVNMKNFRNIYQRYTVQGEGKDVIPTLSCTLLALWLQQRSTKKAEYQTREGVVATN